MATQNSFFLKSGDTFPAITVILTETDSLGADVPIDLTGSSVTFRLFEESVQKKPQTLLFEASATIVSPQTGVNIGKVFYDWQAGNTDMRGTHEAEWKVIFPSGKIAIFPRGTDAKANLVVIE